MYVLFVVSLEFTGVTKTETLMSFWWPSNLVHTAQISHASLARSCSPDGVWPHSEGYPLWQDNFWHEIRRCYMKALNISTNSWEGWQQIAAGGAVY